MDGIPGYIGKTMGWTGQGKALGAELASSYRRIGKSGVGHQTVWSVEWMNLESWTWNGTGRCLVPQSQYYWE